MSIFTLAACKKENTPDNLNIGFMPSSTDMLLLAGSFENEVHPTSGNVKLYKNDTEHTLSIENLKSDNGPDLRVYLSEDKTLNKAIALGALKAISGSFQYTFDLNADVGNKNFVLIWCEDFSVLFGSAELK